MATGWAPQGGVSDAHRHLGVLPAHPFYGGPPVSPGTTAVPDVRGLLRAMDEEGTERALVIPNYGVPDVAASFALNDVVLEAAAHDDRVRAGLWVSPRPQDADLTAQPSRRLARAG